MNVEPGTDTIPPNRDAFTVPEVAERIGISAYTLRDAINRGEIKAGRLGRQFLIPTSEVRRLISQPGPSAAASGATVA